MARKKDPLRHRKTIRKRKRRKAKRGVSTSFSEFLGTAEPLESREMLSGDSVELLTPSALGHSKDDQLDIVESAEEGVTAAVASLTVSPTSIEVGEQNQPEAFNLDLSGIAEDLLVNVQRSNANNNIITVQKLGTGTGTGGIATYAVTEDKDGAESLVVGHTGKKVKVVLDGELDLKVAAAGQVAIGRDAAPSGLLTADSQVEVVQNSTGGIKTLEIDAGIADLELIVGADIYAEQLKGSPTTNLTLNYPEASRSSGLVKALDLSIAPPYVQGFGSLLGISANNFVEVKTGAGRQELRVSDQAISLSGGDKDDVLLGQNNSQTLRGQAGNDFLRAGDGDDTLEGGDGNDQLEGGPGNDSLDGGAGNDIYYFGDANPPELNPNAWGTADTLNDSGGLNTLDFANISANLDVTINGDSVTVSADEEINLPDGLSYATGGNPVELELGDDVVPTVRDFGEDSAAVEHGSLNFKMILGSGRDQISVTAPTLQEVTDKIAEEATVTTSANVTIQNGAGGMRIVAAQGESIAYKVGTDDPGDGQAANSTDLPETTELLLRDVLGPIRHLERQLSIIDDDQKWAIPETTLTLAVGASPNDGPRFEVTLFSEPIYRAFPGTIADLNAELQFYYQNKLGDLIAEASARQEIVADPDRVNEITEELWLDSIASQIQDKFSITNEVNVEVLPAETGDGTLSISVEGDEDRDIAVAPMSVSLPASLFTGIQTQTVSGTAAISRFVAPSNNNVQNTYDIDELTRDLTISFDGDEAKSTLDVSDIDKEMRITFTGDKGQLTVEISEDGSDEPITITAAGISTLIVGGTTAKTYVLTEDGGLSQFNVTDNGTGERHLVLGEGFREQTVVLNNDANDPFVVGGDSYPAHDLEFEGGDLAAPNFGTLTFDSVRAEGNFFGHLHAKSVAIVDSGRGDDLIEMTVATPTGEVVATNDGDDKILGSDEVDVVEAGDGRDTLTGNAGNDDLRGGDGDDRLIGGEGDDTLTGGKDDDTYVFDATGWGKDVVVETKGGGSRDSIEFTSVAATMTHVISGNNYHGFTGEDKVKAAQAQLAGETRSKGKIQIAGADFDPNNVAHVDAVADRVSMENSQFQFIERIATSRGENAFYFGNQWGPSSALASIAGALAGNAATLLAPTSDRVLEIDTSNATKLTLDFRQVTDELRFEFVREDDGSTSLKVVKTKGFDVPLLNLDLIDADDMQHNAIKFTNVDEQTTIYGGREVNTFALKDDARFDGNIIGGEGYRDWVNQLVAGSSGGSPLDLLARLVEQIGNINSLLGGKLPEIFVTNVIDNSDASVTVIEGDSLLQKAKSGLNNLFFDASLVATNKAVTIKQLSTGNELPEVQTVLLTDLPNTDTVEFTFNDVVTVSWPTSNGTLTDADLAPAIPVTSVIGDGSSRVPLATHVQRRPAGDLRRRQRCWRQRDCGRCNRERDAGWHAFAQRSPKHRRTAVSIPTRIRRRIDRRHRQRRVRRRSDGRTSRAEQHRLGRTRTALRHGRWYQEIALARELRRTR